MQILMSFGNIVIYHNYIGDMIENRRLRFVNTTSSVSFPVFVVIRFVFVVFFSFS